MTKQAENKGETRVLHLDSLPNVLKILGSNISINSSTLTAVSPGTYRTAKHLEGLRLRGTHTLQMALPPCFL